MDPRQQASFTPFELRHAGRESPPQHEPFVLQRAQPKVDVTRVQSQSTGDRDSGGRAGDFQAPPHQLADRLLARPRLGAVPLRRHERRLAGRAGIDRLEHRQPLCRHPHGHWGL